MKRIITLLAALVAIAIYVRPASAACPTDAGFRDFPLYTLNRDPANLIFGNITITAGGITVETVGACNKINNTVELFRNGLNPEFYTSLPQDTKLCLYEGNDVVRVLRTGETATCGNFPMKALNYGGKRLMLVGMQGTDTLTGGDQRDILNLVTDDTASSSDRAASGRGNDTIRLSSVSTSRAWGGSGNDTYMTGGGATGTRRVQDFDGNGDIYNGTGQSVDKFCDGNPAFLGVPTATDAFCGDTPGDLINIPFLEATCPYQFECEPMGATIPRTDV